MAVHAQRASLKVIKAIFEARYDEGYRYLDRCGETLIQIKKYSPSWIPGQIDPQRGVVTNFAHQFALNMGSESMVVATTNDELEYSAMEKKLEVFAQEAEALYKIVVDTLKVPNTTRVGMRAQFMAPADALEDANRFVRDAAASPLRDSILKVTKTELRISSAVYVLEEPESGLRRRVEITPVARVQAGVQPTGLKSDQGSGGVLVDIDSFTRPDEGHLPKASMFIQKNFLAGHSIAIHVLEWLSQHQ